MVYKTQERIQVGLLVLAVCLATMPSQSCRPRDASSKSYTSRTARFQCEIPSDWKYINTNSKSDHLAIFSHDYDNERGASILVTLGEPGDRPEKLRDSMRRLRGDEPDFSIDPVTRVSVGKYQGLMLSSVRSEHSFASHRTGPMPPPFMYRETDIWFDTPYDAYHISYGAPVVLYEKYKPAFERLLATFKWTGRWSWMRG